MPQPNAGQAQQPVKEAANDGAEQQEAEVSQEAEAPWSTQNVTDTSTEELAKHLNLPAEAMQEVQRKAALKGKTSEKKGAKSDGPADAEAEEVDAESQPEAEDEQTEHPSAESEDETPAPEAEGDSEPEEESEEEGQPKAVRKLVKRNKSLTKRLRAAEAALQERETAQPEAQQQSQTQRAPSSLSGVRTEQELDDLVAQAEAGVDWFEAHADGYTDEKTGTFYDEKDIASRKRIAEKVIRNAEARRRQIREYTESRTVFDKAARDLNPELFDKTTKDYQAAVRVVSEGIINREHPGANYLLAVLLEGYKTIGQRKNVNNSSLNGKNGHVPVAEEDDVLDERLTPEYQRTRIPPTATPATKPPNRGITPSHLSREKVDNISKQFTQPGGATVTNLAKALEVINEDEPRGRRPVAV